MRFFDSLADSRMALPSLRQHPLDGGAAEVSREPSSKRQLRRGTSAVIRSRSNSTNATEFKPKAVGQSVATGRGWSPRPGSRAIRASPRTAVQARRWRREAHPAILVNTCSSRGEIGADNAVPGRHVPTGSGGVTRVWDTGVNGCSSIWREWWASTRAKLGVALSTNRKNRVLHPPQPLQTRFCCHIYALVRLPIARSP
jgi:hypothetical protein